MLSEETIAYEAEQERLHQKALEACDLMADGNRLKVACAITSISPSEFMRRVKMHDDVRRAWDDARVVRAELRIDRLDDLSEQALAGTLEAKAYSAVAATDKWLIEKLLPETYGKRQTVETNVSVQGGVIHRLQALSDDDLLALAQSTALQPAVPLLSDDTSATEQLVIEADVEEVLSGQPE